jgi:hypothetical protein
MAKKLLLNLINGVLLVSFCNMGKAVGAAPHFSQEKKDVSGVPLWKPRQNSSATIICPLSCLALRQCEIYIGWLLG